MSGNVMLTVTSDARKHGIFEVRTQASWKDHGMLGFLDHAGFQLGGNQVIDCEIHARTHRRRRRGKGPGAGAPSPERRDRPQRASGQRFRGARARPRRRALARARGPRRHRAHRPAHHGPRPQRLHRPRGGRGAARFGDPRLARRAPGRIRHRLRHGAASTSAISAAPSRWR